jgi:hypothetical protein
MAYECRLGVDWRKEVHGEAEGSLGLGSLACSFGHADVGGFDFW